MSTETVYLLLPEIVLVLVATAIYLGGAFAPAREGWGWLAIAGLLLAVIALYKQQHNWPLDSVAQDGASLLSGPLIVDNFSLTLRWAILGVGIVFVLLGSHSAPASQAPEYLGSLLLIVAGLMLVVLSGDLVLMFLGLELVSIPTYVLLYLGRGDSESQEAATKYFFLSILSSAVLLYGFSFLYGVSGSTDLRQIYTALRSASPDDVGVVSLSTLAVVLIFAGLGFRITAVPFHFYAPDVYQGTSYANAALLAVVPKIAGLAALVRIGTSAMAGVDGYLPHVTRVGWQLSLALAILTMTVGNVMALWQTNVRRLLAYSSIAHAGYMLIGLAVSFAVSGGAPPGNRAFDGVGSTMFYLLVYALATTGAFAALAWLSSRKRQLDTVEELAGLGQTYPLAAVSLAICMFSLTGLPPFAGFWGKLNLFFGALGVDYVGYTDDGANHMRYWFAALAIAGVVNAAISAAYYLRVVAAMYFRQPITRPAAEGGLGPRLAMAFCAVAAIAVGLFPGPLVDGANQAGRAADLAFKSKPAAAPAVSEKAPALPAVAAKDSALAPLLAQ